MGGRSINIPFADSPKILISTNYTVKGVGDSYRDRMIEVEFSDYYNASHKPKDDFGKLFFDEWDEEEWSKFDNFMVGCASYYLQNGIIEYTPINTIKKKIIEITGEDFYEFASANIMTGSEYIKSDLFNEFKLKCPENKNITSKAFSSFLKKYCEYLDYSFEERKSDGKQYFAFIKK